MILPSRISGAARRDPLRGVRVEVRRMNTASKISQREVYRLMLKDYPDVMSIEPVSERPPF